MTKDNISSLDSTRLNENLIVGSGKLARHFSYYLELLQVPFLQVSRKSHSAEAIKDTIAKSHRVFLAISDSAIEDFIKKYYIKEKIWIHFSGALNVHHTVSCHPLMSFSETLYSLEVYKKIHFVVCDMKNPLASLGDLVPFLENTFTCILPEQKEQYHAYCVMAGNFPILLWAQVFNQFNELKIPSQALDLYLQNNLNNFICLKEKALTGPLQRKDILTINNNINALKFNANLQEIYRAFVRLRGINL